MSRLRHRVASRQRLTAVAGATVGDSAVGDSVGNSTCSRPASALKLCQPMLARLPRAFSAPISTDYPTICWKRPRFWFFSRQWRLVIPGLPSRLPEQIGKMPGAHTLHTCGNTSVSPARIWEASSKLNLGRVWMLSRQRWPRSDHGVRQVARKNVRAIRVSDFPTR